MPFHASTCPYCSCGCALLLHEEDGRLRGSYPCAGGGGRAALCMRGWNCTTSVSHPDRLAAPMIRGGSGLVRVSWQEAVAEVAARLESAASPALFALGPTVANEDALAVRRLANRFGARVATTDLSGAPAARLALRRVLGRAYGLRDLDAVAGADLVWLVGVDDDDCPQIASRVIEARRNGGTVVRFDACASGGADSRAVTAPPDELGRLPLILQHAICSADLALPAAREAGGADDLVRYWRSAPAPAPSAWMPAGEALALAHELAAARSPVVILGSRWLTTPSAEEDTTQLLQALALLGLGERVLPAVGETNSWGGLDVLGDDAPPAELALREENLDTLVVVADDLVRRSPRPAGIVGVLDRLRTLVVVDRFATDTTPFADVILPACTYVEIDGTTTNVFGAECRWRPVVAPPAECRAERDWAARIGERAGVEKWRAAAEGPVSRPAAETTRARFSPPAGDATSGGRSETAGFPMRLVLGTHVANWSTGTVSQREDLLRREFVESTLAAAPSVLEKLGVKPGWRAKVLVPGGEATLTVRADRRLPPDVLVLVALAGSPPASLRGWYPGAGGRGVGVQPVPARLERA